MLSVDELCTAAFRGWKVALGALHELTLALLRKTPSKQATAPTLLHHSCMKKLALEAPREETADQCEM